MICNTAIMEYFVNPELKSKKLEEMLLDIMQKQ